MQAANKHMPAETTNCRVGNCPAETSHYRGQDLRQVRDSGTSQLRDKASRQQQLEDSILWLIGKNDDSENHTDKININDIKKNARKRAEFYIPDRWIGKIIDYIEI